MITSHIRRLSGLTPRVDYFSQKLHDNLSTVWRGATRAFVEAILMNSIMSVDTGMSKASLLPLSRAVRMVTTARLSISPQVASRKGSTDMEGRYNPNLDRSMALGEKVGEKAFHLNYGSRARPVFHFDFSIQVYQYLLHEDSANSTKSQNWQTVERGMKAFDDFIKENAPKALPKLPDWIIKDTK